MKLELGSRLAQQHDEMGQSPRPTAPQNNDKKECAPPQFHVIAQLVNLGIALWVRWLYLRLWFRLANYQNNQRALAQRYQLDGVSPEPYNETTRARIIRLAESDPREKQFAWTSGTTREPKQIFYPVRRARRIQRTLLEQVLLAYDYAGLKRPAFYALTSMTPDKSWSSLFIRRTFPAWLNRSLLSGSILFVPQAAELVGRYSQSSVHVALWLLCEPAFIVTANPSSLYVVLEQAGSDWARIRNEVQGILSEPAIARLQQSIPGLDTLRQSRIERLLDSETAPSVHDILPALRVVYCWDGGYVQPFIGNLERQSAAHPIRFLPMFSVSTETVSYQVYPRLSTRGGLPLYPGNCYEFLPPESEMLARNVLKPWELEPGKEYVLLVSDAYGLKRYNTEDVFQCRGMQRHTPVLHFMGRAGLRYSFTGEKITAEQLLELYDSVRRELKLPGAIFTCFPARNTGRLPGYVFVYCAMGAADLPRRPTAADFDARLAEINIEYAAKRSSGRLAPPELVLASYARLADAVRESNPRYRGSNPAQFKLLPLYKTMWEDLAPSPPPAEVAA